MKSSAPCLGRPCLLWKVDGFSKLVVSHTNSIVHTLLKTSTCGLKIKGSLTTEGGLTKEGPLKIGGILQLQLTTIIIVIQ